MHGAIGAPAAPGAQQAPGNQKAAPGQGPIGLPTAGDKSFGGHLLKTKLCLHFARGRCSYGDRCAFAHDKTELRTAPNLRKTRLCPFYRKGFCAGGCDFAHGEHELARADLFYKKKPCAWYEAGVCRLGNRCRFAHGTDEMPPVGCRRRPPADLDDGSSEASQSTDLPEAADDANSSTTEGSPHGSYTSAAVDPVRDFGGPAAAPWIPPAASADSTGAVAHDPWRLVGPYQHLADPAGAAAGPHRHPADLPPPGLPWWAPPSAAPGGLLPAPPGLPEPPPGLPARGLPEPPPAAAPPGFPELLGARAACAGVPLGALEPPSPLAAPLAGRPPPAPAWPFAPAPR